MTAWRVGAYLEREAALRLDDLGVRTAIAPVDFGFPARSFLTAMGFVPVGGAVLLDDRPRQHTLTQCLHIEVARERRPAWDELRQGAVERLAGAGYLVDSDLPSGTPSPPPGLARHPGRGEG